MTRGLASRQPGHKEYHAAHQQHPRPTLSRSEAMMAPLESSEPFSVLGGPLHHAGRWLGLVRGETNTVLLGIALGWGPWLLILGLALIEGIADRMLSMALVAAHARLLLVIPLIFISESWVTRMSACVATIARYGIVSPDDRPALDAEVSRTRRWANWWWPEVVCFVLFGN